MAPSEGRLGRVAPERYVAFLLSTLPKLAQRRLYPQWWLFPRRRYAVLDAALRAFRHHPGVGLEFGVYRGASLRHAARRCPDRQFYGFDSFTGLPEDGRPDWRIDFATALPQVAGNCRLIPGWFDNTIPEFLVAEPAPIGFVNIDCDIYSSARTVLFGLGDRLRPGAVLYFDELINYDTFIWNEMLALFEFLEATGFGIDWLAVHCRVRSIEQTLAHYAAGDYPPWEVDVRGGYHRPAAAVLTARNADLGLLESSAERPRIDALAAKLTQFAAIFDAAAR